MLVVDGVVRIVPGAVSTDAGELRVGEESQPSVIQTLMTEVGNFQVIFPASAVPEIIKGLEKGLEQANEKAPEKKPDLYIPGSANEVEQIADAHKKISEGKT